ncbi:hypothetical protein [Pseudomonas vancouverensis]|nr:hypothetical protein [Pseudomonas vancouverensis]
MVALPEDKLTEMAEICDAGLFNRVLMTPATEQVRSKSTLKH